MDCSQVGAKPATMKFRHATRVGRSIKRRASGSQILAGTIELKKCVPLKAINQVVKATLEDGLHVLLGHISDQSVTASMPHRSQA